MARQQLAPTRTNLLRVKGDLSFAREGYELLEQKREILILELKRFTARAIEAQRKADTELAAAFRALRNAELVSGISETVFAGLAVNIEPLMALSERRVMGVGLPAVNLSMKESAPHYGPAGTSVWTDEAVQRFKNALTALGALAESRISVIRLAREIQKTIRRVNALERILIPEHEETLQYVESSLEESDREAFSILKLVKDRLEARGR
jgi:V/A-type H+/Na+-transporting ATPase subunit D